MGVTFEIFYDLSSPWTRVAFHNIRQQIDGTLVSLRWRPFLVGGVFNAVNDSVYAGRQNPDNPKFRLGFVWLKEWAALSGVPMNFPSAYHPIKSVNAMRLCCALEEDQDSLVRFSEAAFHAYFGNQRNIDDPEVLRDIAIECSLDGDALIAATGTQAVKDRLRANTQDAIDRGAFGSPTFFVDQRYMYFGNDQLPLVKRRIALATAGSSNAK